MEIILGYIPTKYLKMCPPTPDLSAAGTGCQAGSLAQGAPHHGTARPLCPPCLGRPTSRRRTGAPPHTPSGQPGSWGTEAGKGASHDSNVRGRLMAAM